MFLNSCPVFLALVVCVGLPLGQVLFAGASSQELLSTVVPVKLSVERQGDIIAEAWTLCSTAFSKVMLSLDFNLLEVVMQ